DPSANAQFTKKSDAARRTATTFFEASERFLVADRGIAREEAMLTYDGRATEEGERYKTIDAAEQATKPGPALYQACRDVAPKICSQASVATLRPNRKLAADQPAWHSQPTTPP